MLLVVFGAGASHDSLDVKPPRMNNPDPNWYIDEGHRLPLANELFGSRALFADQMKQFEVLQPILVTLRRAGTEGHVEATLRELMDDTRPVRTRQLMAVRYYLQMAISECQRLWEIDSKNASNYKALLDQIDQFRGNEEVCLATFNYDTLLEQAMPAVGLTITEMQHYVSKSHPYRVFKLHGSINWARTLKVGSGDYSSKHAWTIALRHIEDAAQLDATNTFVRSDQRPCAFLETKDAIVGLVPAIAIPVEQKSYFECPKEHLDELQSLLQHVDKLLLIGWRATEEHFLALLGEHLKGRPIRGQAVAKDKDSAKETTDKFKSGPAAGLNIDWEHFDGGFSEFVATRRVENLLK